MISDCKHIIHPFQTDPGTSQHQRLSDELLSGKAKIDNRSLADLLDFFVQLSRNVNYYDEKLNVSDWQPFFSKSLPFILTAVIKYDRNAAEQKLSQYKKRFDSKPSAGGLHLLLRYSYTNIIKKINAWQLQVTNSGIPVETVMDKLMKDKLSGPVKNFIKYSNAATHWYGTKGINFNSLLSNPAWLLVQGDLYKEDETFRKEGNTKRKRLIALYNKVFQLIQTFHDVIRLLSVSAEQSLDQSILPLKEELKEKNPPHLAILFAFIKLFQYLQGDLNGYTKRHLDFFYKQVLKLKPKAAEPDKVHLVLDIQQQLDKYLFKKGLLFKDGKDNNKAEIYFASDDEIVVNKAQVADQRTLFLNNQSVRQQQLPGVATCENRSIVEGVYMAPNATMANGVDKDFKDALPSRATLGSKWSKYIDPENKFTYPYPNARLGFILASPVLLLNEGTRTITISLSCQLQRNYCESLVPEAGVNNPCCDPGQIEAGKKTTGNATNCLPPVSFADVNLVNQLSAVLSNSYYYISQPLIAALIKKGISKELKESLQNLLVIKHLRADQVTGKTIEVADPNVCFCGWEEKLFDITLPAAEFEPKIGQPGLGIIKDFIYPRKAFSVLFSGEKEWIAPVSPEKKPLPAPVLPDNLSIQIKNYTIIDGKFELEITATILPDQKTITFYNAEALKEDFNTSLPVVKIEMDDKIKLDVFLNNCGEVETDCCDREPEKTRSKVSLYHFFRDVKVLADTKIDVQVCGLKNFIVQNDESLQNVNAPVYPFGTRPSIIDFDIVNPVDPPPAHKNLIGPDFYIGSEEVFCKNWQSVRVNLNWKNKPANFREYYKAYVVEDVATQVFGLDENEFKIRIAALDEGKWIEEAIDRKLFDNVPPPAIPPVLPAIINPCNPDGSFTQGILLKSGDYFAGQERHNKISAGNGFTNFNVNSRNGFIKINLRNQDFLHKDYAYALARQMMALGKYPDAILEGAVYKKEGDTVIVFRSIGKRIVDLRDFVVDADDQAQAAQNKVNSLNTTFDAAIDFPPPLTSISNGDRNTLIPLVHDSKTEVDQTKIDTKSARDELKTLQEILDIFDVVTGKISKPLTVLIPNEPWTPIISNIAIDYTATATQTDIDLIHLYPYTGTYKAEELEQQPMLFPTFCDEGNFFIGLKNLVPGSNLNILFQLAEATADSESEREALVWYYLENNEWKLLRTGFEVLNDDTDGLTTSGIIKFALPANMTNENSVLPAGLHWIKATIPCASRSVSELTGIHTQAVKASFTNDESNDKLRLAQPLAAGSVAKLKVADTAVKKISQPYESFGGRVPEDEGHFYIRASELLRHKNRAIQKFDYERLVLEAFPKIFKVKCINHTYALDASHYINDFPVAPGYVLIAVIPDLNQLKAAQSFEPKVPVSLLEQIEAYLKKIVSPFVRMRIMNPRYEKVNFCIRVKLLEGRDEVYYKEQLGEDIKTFLAPWAIGEYEKLAFGQAVSKSDIIRFIESRDYVDYIIDLKMVHEDDNAVINNVNDTVNEISPVTARSILIAGSVDVCIDDPGCETWCDCNDPAGQLTLPCCDHPAIPVHPDTSIVIT
ncbi:MAG: hypothetical protein ABJC98_18845 [Bacteroidota bacterium]